ncbi:hypothetical protein JHK86_048009 [Glycine max]|nr:hypothetical protein JHK86_048009 [Glycine max]
MALIGEALKWQQHQAAVKQDVDDMYPTTLSHTIKAITNLVLSGLKDVTGRGVMGAAQGLGSVAFAKASVSLENLLLEECNRFTLTRIIVALSFQSLVIQKCPGFGSASLAMIVQIVSPTSAY